MLVKYHIILGAIASFLIYLAFQITPFQATIIFLASFLIDFDHYLAYIFYKKDLSLHHACLWFLERRRKWVKLTKKQKEEYKRVILIFHGIEFLIILLALSFYNKIFLFVLIGISIHLILDYIDQIYYGDKIYSKLSQIFVYLKNKNKKEFQYSIK